ncbi:MAG: efflux RND transporter periplasmic adaptor subunit [Anaerolineales bacterium]|nr:MAG: efflux RND transporter periplasmic adaptor subunit [Anaerolineales bacterium]
MKRGWIFLSLLLVAGLVISAGYMGFQNGQPESQLTSSVPNTIPITTCDVTQSVTAPGTLVNTREVAVEMPMTAQLGEVLVRPGDFVQEGQILARLANYAELAANVSEAKLELLKAEGDLLALTADLPYLIARAYVDMLDAQQALEQAQTNRDRLDLPRADVYQLEQAEAYLKLAEARLQKAQKAFNNVAKLSVTHPKRMVALNALLSARAYRNQRMANLNWYLGKPSEQQLVSLESQIALAQADFEAAQMKWEGLQDGHESLDMKLAAMLVTHAETRLAAAEKALAAVEIKAPFSGVVLQVNARPGSTATAYTPLVVLNDPTAVEVEATIIEEDYPYIEIGQPVNLFFDALPDAELVGKTTRILPKRASGDRPLYFIYISLDQIPESLVGGMNADSSVVISQLKDVLCLPRSMVSSSSQGQAIVEVWSGEQIEKRAIKIGLRGDVNVEIISGLVEGDLVVSR